MCVRYNCVYSSRLSLLETAGVKQRIKMKEKKE